MTVDFHGDTDAALEVAKARLLVLGMPFDDVVRTAPKLQEGMVFVVIRHADHTYAAAGYFEQNFNYYKAILVLFGQKI